ncbi:MAG TPA: hypothetical protein EYG85_08180 [Crocinitomix sp.]|nr:hypothetical protein [Crocinitomix sp.]
MSIVTSQSIEKAIQKIDKLSDDALEKLIETFTLQQEELVNYLMQAGFDFENEELNAFTIYYFVVIIESFYQENVKLNTVTENDISEFQEGYLLALDEIRKEEFIAMHELLNQPHLINFILNELESEDEDGESFDDETQNQLFIVLMGLIGLLNNAIKK